MAEDKNNSKRRGTDNTSQVPPLKFELLHMPFGMSEYTFDVKMSSL